MEIVKNNIQTEKEALFACIMNSLEEGRIPWRKSWRDGAQYASNYSSKYKFRGINDLIAGCSAFDTPYFLTLRQIAKLGGKLRKNANALPMIFWQKEVYGVSKK